MLVVPPLPLRRSWRSKLSLRAKTDMTITVLTFGLWIDVCMKLLWLMTRSSLGSLFSADVVGDGTGDVVGPLE
jgi:hypothetical protein